MGATGRHLGWGCDRGGRRRPRIRATALHAARGVVAKEALSSGCRRDGPPTQTTSGTRATEKKAATPRPRTNTAAPRAPRPQPAARDTGRRGVQAAHRPSSPAADRTGWDNRQQQPTPGAWLQKPTGRQHWRVEEGGRWRGAADRIAAAGPTGRAGSRGAGGRRAWDGKKGAGCPRRVECTATSVVVVAHTRTTHTPSLGRPHMGPTCRRRATAIVGGAGRDGAARRTPRTHWGPWRGRGAGWHPTRPRAANPSPTRQRGATFFFFFAVPV